MTREQKFRQAAFVYLHVGILYEAAVWVMWRRGLLGDARGPVWLWMLAGAVVVAVVVWGLWSWRNVWFARLIWAIHALRVPFLIQGAFLAPPDQRLAPGFYLTALVVVLINLAALARAGWDL